MNPSPNSQNPLPPDEPLDSAALDELLGLDPAPRLSPGAVARIHAHLAEADSAALEGLLGLDDVAVPAGLAARIKVAARRRAPLRRLRLVPGLAAAALVAAAAVAVVVLGRGDLLRDGSNRGASGGGDRDPGVSVANADPALPSDELLAALPVLEDLDFLIEELDPLEADALFLFDDGDDLLFDLVSDAGLLGDDR